MHPPRIPYDAHAMHSLLSRLGLDQREVDVYLALLSLGIASASQVAKAANQQRSNTYIVLRSLKEKGLISDLERGKILHFAVEPPDRLLVFADQQEARIHQTKLLLENALPLLQSIATPLANKPRVTITTGFEGMKDAYRDLMQTEFLACFDVEQSIKAFGTTITDYFFGVSARKLKGRELVARNETGKRYVAERRTPNVLKQLLPAQMAFQGNIFIFGDTVALFSYDEDKTVVRVENPSIAGMLRAWYEVLWIASSRSAA